ncbi:hypothetical protein BH09ACT3_BH09ACT3_10660 [soil metagenome]
MARITKWSWAVGVATVALVVGAGVAPASAAPATAALDESESAQECDFRQQLVETWAALPTSLRTDLETLKSMEPGAERRAEGRRIAEKARDGGYGEKAQRRAERMLDRRADRAASLPADLKADLRQLSGTSGEERRDLVKEIAQNALDGDYGDKSKRVVEKIEQSDAWQECVVG